jgi:hypothetical protein
MFVKCWISPTLENSSRSVDPPGLTLSGTIQAAQNGVILQLCRVVAACSCCASW